MDIDIQTGDLAVAGLSCELQECVYLCECTCVCMV